MKKNTRVQWALSSLFLDSTGRDSPPPAKWLYRNTDSPCAPKALMPSVEHQILGIKISTLVIHMWDAHSKWLDAALKIHNAPMIRFCTADLREKASWSMHKLNKNYGLGYVYWCWSCSKEIALDHSFSNYWKLTTQPSKTLLIRNPAMALASKQTIFKNHENFSNMETKRLWRMPKANVSVVMISYMINMQPIR